jgi:hypothetical protein
VHCMIHNTQTLEHIESMHDKVEHTTFDMYRGFLPQFQFCAILHLLLLRSSNIALGVLHILLVSTVQKPLVSMTNLTCTLCVYKNKHRHLLSQNAFEMLVPFFV